MLLTAEQQGQMVFHILQQGYHRPLVEGKANRDKIEDEIVIGLYNKEIPPLNDEDVDLVCLLVNELIDEHSETE
jgi:hypothetical protein